MPLSDAFLPSDASVGVSQSWPRRGWAGTDRGEATSALRAGGGGVPWDRACLAGGRCVRISLWVVMVCLMRHQDDRMQGDAGWSARNPGSDGHRRSH